MSSPHLLHAHFGRRPAGARRAPGPRGEFLLGNVRPLRDRPLEALHAWREEHGDVVRLRFGPYPVVFLAGPEQVKDVLHDRWKSFSKRTRGWEKLRPVIGNGLITSEGDFWLRQRRLIQPSFDKRALPRLTEAMVRATREIAERWEIAARHGTTVDVAEDMMRLAMRVVGETLLGTDVTREAAHVGEAMEFLQAEINHRVFSLLDLPEKLPLRRTRRFEASLAALDRTVHGMVRQRRGAEQAGDDLLGRLLHATDDETGERMSDTQLRDELMTLFLAGHETTANGLAWTFFELMRHPEQADRLAAYAWSVVGEGDVRAEHLDALDRAEHVFEEGMRLHPPVWINERMAEEDLEIGGWFVPAGTIVLLSPWVTHRHPDHWTDPEAFDPDRFLPARRADRHRFAYFPFGGGPRTCIGNHFALQEAKIVLAMLGARFRLESTREGEQNADPLVTLRPQGGIPARVHLRESPRHGSGNGRTLAGRNE